MNISGIFAVMGIAASALAVTASAHAVTQPNGTVIPVLNGRVTTCANGNVENCLNFSEQANLIDAQADALVAPETFQPTCTLTFQPITKGGTLALAFGWYNVTAQKPLASDLHVMVVLPGQYLTPADLAPRAVQLDLNQERQSGAYKDGKVGFWLATGNGLSIGAGGILAGSPSSTFYTEHAFNPGSTATETYYQVLTWQSVAVKNAFYFGWEDLVASSRSDNDFDDLLFLVTGIQCSGGGQACDTGQKGVCAAGTMQCQKGELSCVRNVAPSSETCNALDDNCDGTVDEGDLCATGEVCLRGRCVPKCGSGEFRCSGSDVCTTDGLCVEAACATVECPAGQVCIGGACKEACTGVVCPFGRVCQNGGCVDACATVTCDPGFTCVLGVCSSCECTECSAGQVCANDVCVDSACGSVTCAATTHCSAGNCVDNCDGATCPAGQICSGGECVVDANSAAGGSGSGTGGGLTIDPDAGVVILGGSGGQTSSTGGDAPRGSGTGSACACRAVGGPNRSSPDTLVLFALVALTRARRRRGRSACSCLHTGGAHSSPLPRS